MTCSQSALYRETYITLKNFVPGWQKTCHTLLPGPQKHCLAMRGYCLSAGTRRVTLSYFIAGPLAQIFQQVMIMPSRRHLSASVTKLTILRLYRDSAIATINKYLC
jgi:hypothetical protein